eukprot:gnl/Trimastix_PCT/3874.p1 GENE.gnl/Trimastix_PCT/3874~~gnl/Trimastix_PCT/3874.p1  ORF type:complete len:907 (-),score=223.87 gnl/Trimastix_PCT/3874:4-2664(-)
MTTQAKLSVEQAKRHALQFKLVKADPDQEYLNPSDLYPFCTSLDDIMCGVGVSCYFYFLRFSAVLFIILSVLYAPMLVFNFLGGAIPFALDPGMIMAKFTLGNRIDIPFWYGLIDLGGGAAFVLAMVLLKRKMEQRAVESDLSSITVEDYSIRVTNVPKTLKDASQLAQHFSRWGEIHSVLLCFNVKTWAPFQESMYKAARMLEIHNLKAGDVASDSASCFGRLFRSLGINKDKYYWQRRIPRMNQRRIRFPNPFELPGTGTAFVTFMRSRDCTACRRDYANGSTLHCGFVTKQDGRLPFGGVRLLVDEPPEPSDVIWGNLHIGRFSRILRTLCVNLVALVIIGGCFAGFVLLKNQGRASPWWLSLLFSLLVTVISTVLTIVLKFLTRLEGKHTFSDLFATRIDKIWIADFLNSAGIIFALSMIFLRWEDWFNGAWYSDACFSLQLIILIGAAKRLFFEIVRPVDIVKRFFARRFSSTQNELNLGYEPPEWDLEIRIAELLKVMFVALLVCPAAPLVLPLTAAFLLCLFVVDRYNLLRRFRSPRLYSYDVARRITLTFPWAFHVHALAAFILFFFTPRSRTYFGDRYAAFIVAGYWGYYIVMQIFRHLPTIARCACFRQQLRVASDVDETLGKPFTEVTDTCVQYADVHPLYSEGPAAPDTNSPLYTGVMTLNDYYSFWSAQPHVRNASLRIAPGAPAPLQFYSRIKKKRGEYRAPGAPRKNRKGKSAVAIELHPTPAAAVPVPVPAGLPVGAPVSMSAIEAPPPLAVAPATVYPTYSTPGVGVNTPPAFAAPVGAPILAPVAVASPASIPSMAPMTSMTPMVSMAPMPYGAPPAAASDSYYPAMGMGAAPGLGGKKNGKKGAVIDIAPAPTVYPPGWYPQDVLEK